MKVNDKLSLLFFLSKKRQSKDGTAPIYVRITITGAGKPDEFPIGKKCHVDRWNEKHKMVDDNSQQAKATNSYLKKVHTDLEKLYLLREAQNSQVTPQMLKADFRKKEATAKVKEPASELKGFKLVKSIDPLISKANDIEKEERKISKLRNALVKQERSRLLDIEKAQLKKSIEDVVKLAKLYFDNRKKEEISIMDVTYEFLLFFVRKVASGNRAFSTLKRFKVTKEKLKNFTWYHYKKAAFPILDIKRNYASEMYEYLTAVDPCGNNTANKHVKNFKQILDRSVLNGWLTVNPITDYKCTYIEPDIEGLTLFEIVKLINTDFGEKLNTVRDCFLFSCFTAFAYEEIYQLEPDDIFIGIDGKEWIGTGRRKTDRPELVPLLPIAKKLIEKYNDHPCRVVDGKLFPIYSNQHYNRCLKQIAKIAGIRIELTTHIARHTFATTIALENDMPFQTVGRILGHRSPRSIATYAKVTKNKISRNMQRISDLMFDESGQIKISA